MIIEKASASYLGNEEKYWEFPACWKAIVKGNQIKAWQVFCDSKTVRFYEIISPLMGLI